MEENNEEQKVTNTEDVKTEVKEPANEAKAEASETVKSTNVKKDYTASKNFFKNFFKTPYDEIKKVAESPKSYFIIILVAFIAWVVANLIDGIIGIADSAVRSLYSDIITYFLWH